jgi:hypothetical protein
MTAPAPGRAEKALEVLLSMLMISCGNDLYSLPLIILPTIVFICFSNLLEILNPLTLQRKVALLCVFAAKDARTLRCNTKPYP